MCRVGLSVPESGDRFYITRSGSSEVLGCKSSYYLEANLGFASVNHLTI